MSVSDEVHTELRRRLIAGHYDPGAKLKEEHIASEFGVSRTPVRTAIQKLVSEGLLEPAPKRGAIVSQWGDNDLEEIFELRLFAEGQAAAWAAERISDEQLAKMGELNDEIKKAIQTKPRKHLELIQQANLEFHLLTLEACGSARLRLFGASLLDYPLIMDGFFLYSDEDAMQSVRQHNEIISALTARSPEWARSAVTSHLNATRARFRKSRLANRQNTITTSVSLY